MGIGYGGFVLEFGLLGWVLIFCVAGASSAEYSCTILRAWVQNLVLETVCVGAKTASLEWGVMFVVGFWLMGINGILSLIFG